MTEPGRIDPEQTVVREPAPAPSPATPPTPAATEAEPAPKRPSRIWSNLNLNGPVPARVRPAIGEWGPLALPSTKAKKRARWLAPVAFVAMLVILVLVGWYFWLLYR